MQAGLRMQQNQGFSWQTHNKAGTFEREPIDLAHCTLECTLDITVLSLAAQVDQIISIYVYGNIENGIL